MSWWSVAIQALLLLASVLVDTPDHAFGLSCWEDEVVVMVVSDPWNATTAQFGCVPADNLPVTGYRP